jgi:hypothetical protein
MLHVFDESSERCNLHFFLACPLASMLLPMMCHLSASSLAAAASNTAYSRSAENWHNGVRQPCLIAVFEMFQVHLHTGKADCQGRTPGFLAGFLSCYQHMSEQVIVVDPMW